MKGQKNPRAWLESTPIHDNSRNMMCSAHYPARHQHNVHVAHGMTNTMARAGEYQNMLTAIPHPHRKTGYKSQSDPCNRSDKRNGGEFRRFER